MFNSSVRFLIGKKEQDIVLLINLLKGFVLFEWTPSQRKENGYPIRDFASYLGTEQTFLLLLVMSILTQQLPGIESGAWLDTKQPRRPRKIGI